MNLLHTIGSANPVFGGPIEAVKQVGLALQAAGVNVSVVCGDEPDSPWLADFPFEIHALGPSYGRYGYIPGLGDWLTRNATKYEHVVVNGLWQYHGFAVRAVMQKLGRGYAVYPHGMLDPWFQARYPLKHLKKRLYWRFGEYPVLRDAQAVLFTCEEEARLAGISFTPSGWTSRVVNLGTAGSMGDPELERQAFLKRFPMLVGTRNILFLGRITAKKGVDMLLRAFASVATCDPTLRLVLAGPVDPGLLGPLTALIGDLAIAERVIWTGMLDGQEKWGAYRAAEVFVLPSHQENFGISVAEALSCGVPVLVSDKVNIWREVADGHAGMVQSDTVEGTSALLKDWLGHGEPARSSMSRSALALYSARFEASQAAVLLMAALEEGGS